MESLQQLYKKLDLLNKPCLISVKGVENWEKYLPNDLQLPSKTIQQLEIINPNAFYHFNNVPLILFFENPDTETEKQIHKQSWSFNQSPLIFVIKETKLHIYNAFRYEQTRLEKIEMGNDEVEAQFSLLELQSGNTWDWLEKRFRNIKEYRVDRKLLKSIQAAINELDKEGLDIDVANKIILRLIFIRYLIDRGVIIDSKYIQGEPEESERRRQSFNELLPQTSNLYEFFDYLKERFNGSLFEIGEKEIQYKDEYLKILSLLFSKDDKIQLFLFDIYDFSIIPIELISGIYESVIDAKKRKENSAIYTPPFLVDYILKNTVDEYLQNNSSDDCKILDPACGSGIFLVEAYRRMVDQREKTLGKYQIPDKELIRILENNIYGLDRDERAVQVAIFSLYVALLDYKSPKDIHKISLPELLNKQIFAIDFFDRDVDKIFKTIKLDFIIGNPPWGSKQDKEVDKLHLEYINKYKLPIARYEVAQTFLLRIKELANEKTICALVVTSKAIYNNWAKKFRDYFVKNFFIKQVFDLSASRFLIFEGGINPAMVIFYKYAEGFGFSTDENEVEYKSLKPNIFLRYFNTLVVESEDIKRIHQHLFKNDWMWKVALYGYILDYEFIKRLSSIKSKINDKIDNKTKIFKGKGIFKGTPKSEPFSFLVGLPIMETEKIRRFHSTTKSLRILTGKDVYLEAGRRIELFEGKHIFFKQRTFKESDLFICFLNDSCTFVNSIYSISTKLEEAQLKIFYGIFISKIYTYYQFLTSSSWGIYFPEITLQEYLNFPHLKIKNESQFIELVEKFILYYKENYEKDLAYEQIPFPEDLFDEINRLVYEAYEVDEVEIDLIDYVLDVSRYLFQEGKMKNTALRKVNDLDLRKYAEIFYEHFSEIYNEDGEYFQVEYFDLGYFVAMKFKLVEEKPNQENQIIKSQENDLEKAIFNIMGKRLSLYEFSNDLYVNRNIIGFEEGYFYIIKPNQLKSWHRATARYDLADFIDKIHKAETELNSYEQ